MKVEPTTTKSSAGEAQENANEGNSGNEISKEPGSAISVEEITVEPVASNAPPAIEQDGDLHAAFMVLGSEPGGYTAAFRAADLGLQVVLVVHT